MKCAAWIPATVFALAAVAQTELETPPAAAPPAMNNARIDELIRRIDEHAEGGDGRWQLEFEGYPALVLTDTRADRMRIMVPVAEADGLDRDQLYRLLQANFDAVLDARYAVAQGRLWAVFLHPLASLTEREFFSGLGQAITAAATFGTTYSSGALMFQGGDSGEAQQKYYESIMEKGLSI